MSTPSTDTQTVALLEMLCRWVSLSGAERRVFDVLRQALDQTVAESDAVAQDMNSRFSTLAALAQEQAQETNHIAGMLGTISVGDHEVPLNDVGAVVGDTLTGMVQTLIDVSKRAVSLVYALDDVVSLIQHAEKSISAIEDINRTATFVALNAAIEARRAGDQGRTFLVVADEIKDLSRRTNDLAKSMRTDITAVSTGIKKGNSILQEVASIDMTQHILAKERLDALVACLADQGVRSKAALHEAEARSAEIARHVSALVTGAQHQDRASQQLGLVNTTLMAFAEAQGATAATLRDTLASIGVEKASYTPLNVDDLPNAHKLTHVQRRFIEHALLGKLDDIYQGGGDTADAGDIELF